MFEKFWPLNVAWRTLPKQTYKPIHHPLWTTASGRSFRLAGNQWGENTAADNAPGIRQEQSQDMGLWWNNMPILRVITSQQVWNSGFRNIGEQKPQALECTFLKQGKNTHTNTKQLLFGWKKLINIREALGKKNDLWNPNSKDSGKHLYSWYK